MHPFTSIPPGSRLPVLGALVVLTVGLAWFLGEQGKALKLPPAAPDGLFSLEFAWSAARAQDIVAAWGTDVAGAARRVLLLDFAFALAYPALLALGCAMVAEVPGAPQAAAGLFLSWAVLVAFPLEAAENLALMRILAAEGQATAGDGVARFVGLCAGLKFTLAFAALGYILLAELGLLAGRLGLTA